MVLGVLDALDAFEGAAVDLLSAELESGLVIDGLIADPLTEGSRLDMVYEVDTVVADLLLTLGRTNDLRRMLEGAPVSAARDALYSHIARKPT